MILWHYAGITVALETWKSGPVISQCLFLNQHCQALESTGKIINSPNSSMFWANLDLH